MIKIFLRIAITVLVLVAGIRYMERKSIFFPMRQMALTPDEAGIPYEDIYFTATDGTMLHAWYIPAEKGAEARTVLFSHGNAGNISHRMDKIAMFRDIGVNVLIYAYRGYGQSSGTPSENGAYSDVMGAYEYLLSEKNADPEDIILYGESLGGAVSIYLASKRPVGGLITENTFTSIKDMARLAFPFIPHFVFASRFDSVSRIQEITCPKLIMHSYDDEIVPFAQGEKLFAAAAEPKTFVKLRGGHNTAFMDSRRKYEKALREFI